jgi:hypothetical protein
VAAADSLADEKRAAFIERALHGCLGGLGGAAE